MPLLQEADTDLKPVWEAGSGLSASEKAAARWMVGGRSFSPLNLIYSYGLHSDLLHRPTMFLFSVST